MSKRCQGVTVLGGLAALLTVAGRLDAQAVVTPTTDQVAVYRNDAAHTGYSAETLKMPLSLLWRNTTDPSPDSPASPISAAGTVFFASGGHVYAVRTSDGQKLWQYPAGTDTVGTFSSTPAYDGTFLYIGSDNTQLYKINANTGNQVWSKKVDGAIRGAVTWDNGVIYFGSADTHCYAASADTGDIVWSFATHGPVTTAPAVGGSDVFFASADDSLYCLNKTTGRKVWSEEMSGDPTTAPPVFANDTVFVGAGSDIYAFSARSGETRWSQPLSAEATTSPTIGPGFIGIGTVDGGLSVFNLQGRLRWHRTLAYPAVGVPLLAGGIFLVPGQRGVLYALQATTGKLVWEYVVPFSVTKRLSRAQYTQVTSAPIVVDATLYILSNDGSLSALRGDALDVLPPQVSDLTPTPGSTIGTSAYPSATVMDEGSGIDPGSVAMLLDGQPLSHVIFDASQSQVTVDLSSPDATATPTLKDGAHQVILKAKDWRGNAITRTWGFTMDSQAASDTGGPGNGDNFPGGGFPGSPPPPP